VKTPTKNRRPRHSSDDLAQLKSLDLEAKVRMTANRICQFYDHFDGMVALWWSGGLDSTAMRHIALTVRPDIPSVFCDSVLEYPENRRLCRDGGAVSIRPKIGFRQAIEKYGYPVASKRIAQYVHEVRHTKPGSATERLRLTGYATAGRWSKMSMIPKRWQFLVRAPFAVSHKCCDCLKKRPAARYEKATGRKAIIGTRVDESQQREQTWRMYGCNAYDLQRPRSTPLSFWTHADVREYVDAENVTYSKLYDMGYERSGCMFCMFGVHLEPAPNRFQRMAVTHPKQYQYCLDKLGIREVLEYIGVDYDIGPLFRPEKAEKEL